MNPAELKSYVSVLVFQASSRAFGQSNPTLRFSATELPSSVSFTQKIPNLDLTIYEKEDGIGGTWYVNRYPVSHLSESL
jgi:hypothetical protein